MKRVGQLLGGRHSETLLPAPLGIFREGLLIDIVREINVLALQDLLLESPVLWRSTPRIN